MKKLCSLVAFLAACTMATNVDASIQVHPSSGIGAGPLAPYATSFANFDDLGAAGSVPVGVLSGGVVTVSMLANAQVAQVPPTASNVAAAPFLSGSNGAGFGSQTVPAADTTKFLSAGSTGSVTLQFAPSTYFGILWGSVDSYNVITFYDVNGGTKSFTGSDVFAPAVGKQGIDGTAYVNFVSDVAFNKVVLTNNPTTLAFEVDNVAIGNVPEATTIAVWSGLSLLGWAAYRRRS
ncbi:Npun_F0296 family exosortase-dependent surface protein [Lacipirellula limnantheis]|uniref:PEP-CTERM protein-sorting domain-containing protein n=1 Tax=Lacipirellula limnantheis TaxID=2528024 RepID=A0A517TYB0_9BACT|nr:hypothetical protein [Lacipirellula limnantheis]QDT73362.1 hypothetical protein I41_25510 [Lacipirellula limnantheis]